MGSRKEEGHKRDRQNRKERKEKKEKKKRRRHHRADSEPVSSHGPGAAGGSSGGGSAGRASPPPLLQRQLLQAAALGDRPLCRQLLEQGADLGFADAAGSTALHEACRHGHAHVARMLLRRGADAGLGDHKGNTPAHLAAMGGHLELLAALLQSDSPPEVGMENNRGVSIAELAAQTMDKQDVQAYRKDAEKQAQQRQGERQHERSPSLQPDGFDWEGRLADELVREEGGNAWGAFGGADWHADDYETPDEYARRIWQEMQAHRKQRQQAERSAYEKQKQQEDARRQAYRTQSEAESRRILEEQQQQDASWRQAVAQGQAGAKRASYEARWQFFASKPHTKPISYGEVPWVVLKEGASEEELRNVVLYGTSSSEERRQRLRMELIRWHPDKFQARFGGQLAPEDRDQISQRVVALSQALTVLHAGVQQEQQQQQQQQRQ